MAGDSAIGIWLAFAAGASTCIGGAVVFSKHLVTLTNPKSLSFAMSASCGVMLFISLVEIFGKSVESYNSYFGTGEDNEICDKICDGKSWLAGTITFLVGGLIIYILDFIVHKIAPDLQHDIDDLSESDLMALRNSFTEDEDQAYKSASKIEKANSINQRDMNRTGILTAVALAIHNFPEGVATYISYVTDPSLGFALAVGIALHNIPEGIAVATPIYFATGSRAQGFLWSFISCIAEPLGAFFAYLILGDGIDPFVEGIMFGIVCGMMVTISLKELLPAAYKFTPKGNCVMFGLASGMSLMATSLILFAYAGV